MRLSSTSISSISWIPNGRHVTVGVTECGHAHNAPVTHACMLEPIVATKSALRRVAGYTQGLVSQTIFKFATGKFRWYNIVKVMSFHQSLEDLSVEELDEEENDGSESATELHQRPSSTPPHLRRRVQEEIDLDEQVVPSLRSQDLAGRIRSYQGMLWRRNAKGRARGWTRSWFSVAPGKWMAFLACHGVLVRLQVEPQADLVLIDDV